ncbi:MAG: TIR domain-containing protein [Thiolinea sp.]
MKVFVSYSWGVEDDTGVVDELQRLCRQRDIELIRDREAMQHGESINAFMDDLSGARNVITVFSDAYFKSKWCMYELLKTWWAGGFEQRTHPVNADQCAVWDADYRKSLVTYWQQAYQQAQARWADHEPGVTLDERRHLNVYRDIAQNISDILVCVHQRVTTPLLDLQANDYAPLLDAIKRLPPPFIDTIHQQLTQVLTDQSMHIFSGVVCAELNKLPTYEAAQSVDNQPRASAQHLTHTLRTGGRECPAINKVLRNSVRRCLEQEGDKYAQISGHKERLIQKLEKILGFLVLSLVDEADARDLSQWLRTDLSGLYFELRVGTLGGVEIFMAHQQQRPANLMVDGREVVGRHLIVVDSSTLSWNDAEKVRDIERMIFCSVFDEEKNEPLSHDEREDLKAELITLREIEDEDSNYCVVIQFDHQQDKATYQEKCQKFLSDLQIPLVHYRVQDGQAAFGGIERNLMSALRNLINKINQLM